MSDRVTDFLVTRHLYGIELGTICMEGWSVSSKTAGRINLDVCILESTLPLRKISGYLEICIPSRVGPVHISQSAAPAVVKVPRKKTNQEVLSQYLVVIYGECITIH